MPCCYSKLNFHDLNKKNKTAIYLRGGNNWGKPFGEIRVGAIVNRNAFASCLPHMGYITFYTQYRGIDNQGVDEFGGRDIGHSKIYGKEKASLIC